MNASGSSSQGRRGRKPPAESGAEPIVTTTGGQVRGLTAGRRLSLPAGATAGRRREERHRAGRGRSSSAWIGDVKTPRPRHRVRLPFPPFDRLISMSRPLLHRVSPASRLKHPNPQPKVRSCSIKITPPGAR